MTLAFTAKGERFLTKRNVFAAILAGVITPVGYFVCDAVLLSLTGGGDLLSWQPWSAALAAMPFNSLQGAVSSVLFFAAALALDRFSFQKRLTGWLGR